VGGNDAEVIRVGGSERGSPLADHDFAFSSDDRAHMRRALELARRGIGFASPNPMVGAVIVDPTGAPAAEGWHQGPGTPHAEVHALRDAGRRAHGGTLYVTLEPCSHHGRTPPCTEAIVGAGVARVVAAIQDPNPLVDGTGLARLRDAGIRVDVGLDAAVAGRLIEAFATAITTGLPFVTLKLAMSLDGRVAARDGSSRWITGEASRRDAHRLRSEHDAVMVGAGTAIADDPALTVRMVDYLGRQPIRIVVDGTGRLPPRGRLFDGRSPVWILTGSETPGAVTHAWEAAGARIWTVAGGSPVDVRAGLAAWADDTDRPLRSVLIEGGPTLAWSAISEGLVDRLVVYVAPLLIGGVDAPAALGGEGVATIASAIPIEIEDIDRLGDDLRITGRPTARQGA
jgi:diaminohydroxyphosphoribosylaminopyrimidine deaminase/5-amino-6-(5-phosphoribosylamino)uracil reductase